MPSSDATCWTVVRGAASGDSSARREFARRYLPVVRSYLEARWRHSHLRGELDDAVQEVFFDFFRRDGALARVDAERGGFRGFLYGVTRKTALKVETRRARRKEMQPTSEFPLDQIEGEEGNLSAIFDRAWARAIMEEAAERQKENALAADDQARQRIELVRLRFEEDMPIRDIARLWDTDAATLHREYAKARKEFRAALTQVVAFHHPGLAREVEEECEHLLDLLR